MKWNDFHDRLGNANQLTVIFRLKSPNDIRIQEHHPGSVRGRARPERPEYPGGQCSNLLSDASRFGHPASSLFIAHSPKTLEK